MPSGSGTRSYRPVGRDSAPFGGLRGDPPVGLDGRPERGLGLRPLAVGDRLRPHPPELLDHPGAPPGTLPAGPDRLAADEDIDRVRVELGDLSKGHPAAPG